MLIIVIRFWVFFKSAFDTVYMYKICCVVVFGYTTTSIVVVFGVVPQCSQLDNQMSLRVVCGDFLWGGDVLLYWPGVMDVCGRKGRQERGGDDVQPGTN